MKLKKWQTLVLIVAVVLALVIAGTMAVLSRFNANLEQLSRVEIAEIDLATIGNGEYIGRYGATPVSAEVRVTVENHVIKRIDLLKHSNGQGKAAEALPGAVVAAQSLTVDCVAGATYSSKVILKAIENALTRSGGIP